jgi:hypothetical protein
MLSQCQCCGCDFQPTRNTKGLYCSRTCAARINNKKYPKRTDTLTYCPVCNLQKPKQSKTCSRVCGGVYRQQQYIERWLLGLETGISGKQGTRVQIKRYLFSQNENKCALCGWNEVHPVTGKIPLQIDHINGKWDDNRPENLRLLCPNCHSLTATYGNLNRGNGRSARYNKIADV